MELYLPIAELPVNVFLILGLGALGGLLAGLFGVGGGFVVTPMLIFYGVPPSVAVATSANQIVASSMAGFLAHWRRRNVDIKMGVFLLLGGLVGSAIGVWLFRMLQKMGQIDLAISLSYVLFLGFIAVTMLIESTRAMMRQRKGEQPKAPHRWLVKLRTLPLPFQTHFPHSGLQVSALLPIIVGVVAGAMVSLMGIGGGFVMIPAMLYLLGMPMGVVVGTSLFQIIFTTSLVTFLHAVQTQAVDIVLAFLLIVGGVVGAQIGTQIALRLPAERLRILLALMILGVCIRLGVGLLMEPDSLYSIEMVERG